LRWAVFTQQLGARFSAMQQRLAKPALHILLCIYCLRKSPLRCNISAATGLPDIINRLTKVLKEA